MSDTTKLKRYQYRLVWRRADWDRSKTRDFATQKGLLNRISLMTSDEPWRFIKDFADRDPDEHHCCPGGIQYQCGCGGRTIRDVCNERRADTPKLLWVRVERRTIGSWEVVKDIAPMTSFEAIADERQESDASS